MKRFTISMEGQDGQEFSANIAYLAREWPWPSTPQQIVMRLVAEEATKLRKIHDAVAQSAAKRVSSAASKILNSKTASKAEKAVAAAAMTQTKSTKEVSVHVASSAAKILKDPKASKAAKSVAASALTQKLKRGV